jgi:hypothetical protein
MFHDISEFPTRDARIITFFKFVGGSGPLRRYLQSKYAPSPTAGDFKIIRPRNAPNPNNPPQFARGHSLRLPRQSALRLVPGRCSLGSAIRTVHRTVRISAPATPRKTESKQCALVRKGPFTSSPAPVGAPARDWPLLTGLCDSHRSPDGANLGHRTGIFHRFNPI